MAADSLFLVLLAAATATCGLAQQPDDGDFLFINEPVPDMFQLHQRYPDRGETVVCRPIRLPIARGSRRFSEELVTNDHAGVHFASSDARVMSLRLRERLNELAEAFHEEHGVWVSIQKAWVEVGDADIADPNSLHYEGRSVRVSVQTSLFSPLLQLAVEIGFDWVFYADETYVRMSVIPNLCDVSLDMVFMLDRSGSVGEGNFNTSISFLQEVIGFYDISSDATQVGLISFSTGATVEFDLNDHQSVESVREALDEIIYTRGWTATAFALGLTRLMLDPFQSYGARPFENGIPKVAVLLTDGRSNQVPITDRANALHNFGVQVYTVGIGDIYLPELRFIASDPDSQHVFLLNSFNDAQSFVDRLSLTTCDTPALVDPGEDTRTEIEEDEFRFFESRCAAFSDTVMIEQIDLVGQCSLYASWSVQNPGPLDPSQTVIRNEDQNTNHRTLHLSLPQSQDRFVYVSVRGRSSHNEFSIIIWDMIFTEDEYTISILSNGNTTGRFILNLVDQIRDTDARFNFEVRSGNEEGVFALGQTTGILTAAISLKPGTYILSIVAQNQEHSCHRAKVVVKVIVTEEIVEFNPPLQPVSVSEATDPGNVVAQVSAVSSNNIPPTYAIIDGDPLNQFSIVASSGEIVLASPLDFEDTSQYSLTVRATGVSAITMETQVIEVTDVNESPEFVTECALNGSCEFSVPEGEPAGFNVGTVAAADPDTSNTDFSTLTYTLESDVPIPFQVSGNGHITTTESLDFETVDLYTFNLVVMDAGNPPSSRIQTEVRVVVEDVVENAPPVFMVDCSTGVFENEVPVGTPFLSCQASDPDHPDNQIVYDIIEGNTLNTFRVDPTMGPGILVTTRPLDREEIELYTLTLRATDPEGGSDTTTFTVRILDQNDSPPICSPPSPTITISTSSLPGGAVATFIAADPDLDPALPIFALSSQEVAGDLFSAMIIVMVTDGEDSALSSTCSLSLQFDNMCEEQQYSIDAATGQLSAAFLCSASITPSSLQISLDRSRRITCEVSANVPTNHQFRHNGTAVTPVVTSTSFIVNRVTFDSSGEYDCRVTNNQLGSIISSPVVVEIQSAPMILSLPADVEVEAGEQVEIECNAFGVPEPTITWLTPANQDVASLSDPRIQAVDGTLTISSTEQEDTGSYTCRASNSVGDTTQSTMLTVFSVQQLVVAEVPQYFLPAQDDSCHEFNGTHFNSLLTSITGHTTLTTSQVSDDLCPPSPCNPSPCSNGGECQRDATSHGGYSCQCPSLFTGQTCSEPVDPCTRTPCRNSAVCTSNTPGEFDCLCPNGYHGNRCQYTDICSSSVPCPEDELCLETVVRTEGYVCLGGDVGSGEGVSVGVYDTQTTEIWLLDDEVNNYIETMEDLRRKRSVLGDEGVMADNGFVTTCEGRFIPTSSPDTLQLLWACPVGMAKPSGEDEGAICALLVERRLVASCWSPQTGTLELAPLDSLAPSRVNITFLLLDPTSGRPLSASEVLTVLEETEAQETLNDTIYRTERFSAIAPPNGGSSPSDSAGLVSGVVLGTLSAFVILAVAVVTIAFIARRRHQKDKINTVEDSYSSDQRNWNGTRDLVTFSNHYSQVPQNEDSPLNHLARHAGNGEPLFDDPLYGTGFATSNGSYTPPDTERRRGSLERGMRTSLERGMKLIRSRVPSVRRSDSSSGKVLLNSSSLDNSGDYDDVSTPTHVTTPPLDGEAEPDSEIYANIAHHRGGAMGNAGQRWQSYWQTQTLLRTDPPNTSVSSQK